MDTSRYVEMKDIIREAALKLIMMNSTFSKVSLEFPKYRNSQSGKLRISEQESKIIFSNIFMEKRIAFSIEVPTVSKHSFSGTKGMSARFDLVTYNPDFHEDFDWIIELKAHNPEYKSIKKDIEKMVKSNCNCIWFHTIENENRGTMPSLLKKIRDAFDENVPTPNSTNQCIIAIVVIKKKLLYSKEFNLNQWNSNFINDISKFEKLT